MNALLLIAASAPLFSLVFFFGGVSPAQVLKALLVFVITAIFVGTFAMFCSTLLQRPAVSTAISYMLCLLWIGTPLIISFIMFSSSTAIQATAATGWTSTTARTFTTSSQLPLMFMWNPVTALADTYPPTNMNYYTLGFNPLLILTAGFFPSVSGTSLNTFPIAGMKLTPWLSYTLVSTMGTILFFLLSVWTIKPNSLNRLYPPQKKVKKESLPEKATVTVTQSS
jgi:hypothetical protein